MTDTVKILQDSIKRDTDQLDLVRRVGGNIRTWFFRIRYTQDGTAVERWLLKDGRVMHITDIAHVSQFHSTTCKDQMKFIENMGPNLALQCAGQDMPGISDVRVERVWAERVYTDMLTVLKNRIKRTEDLLKLHTPPEEYYEETGDFGMTEYLTEGVD